MLSGAFCTRRTIAMIVMPMNSASSQSYWEWNQAFPCDPLWPQCKPIVQTLKPMLSDIGRPHRELLGQSYRGSVSWRYIDIGEKSLKILLVRNFQHVDEAFCIRISSSYTAAYHHCSVSITRNDLGYFDIEPIMSHMSYHGYCNRSPSTVIYYACIRK